MNRTETHLQFHLEVSIDTINRYGVTLVSDGPFTCTISCVHPNDQTETVYIWFGSVTAKDLMERFGIRRISQLKIDYPATNANRF